MNPPFDDIKSLVIKHLQKGQSKDEFVLRVTKDFELKLYDVSPGQVGDSLVSNVAINGVRKAFKTIFGFKVIWDAEKIEIVSRTNLVPQEQEDLNRIFSTLST